MAHRRASVPLPQESTGRDCPSPARTRNLETAESHDQTLELVMAGLGKQLACVPLDYDAFLGQIAQHARTLTGASGAAVGLRQQQVVVCRARSGESGPPIGAEVDLSIGISGECLRTGKAVDCKDTEADARVDALACRHLGVRSIAAVPISGRASIAGILEIFSPRPNRFADAELTILAKLAELVTAAEMRDAEGGAAIAEAPAAVPGAVDPGAPDARSVPMITPAGSAEPRLAIPRLRSSDYYLAAAWIFLVGCLLTVLVSKPKRASHVRAHPSTASRQPSLAIPQKDGGSGSTRPNRAETDLGARPIAGLRAKPSGGETSSRDREPAAPVIVPSESRLRREAADSPPLDPPPDMTTHANPLAGASSPLSSMFSTAAGLPQSGFSPSQGISGGSLERSVKPIYPREAVTLRLEGSVVLQAVIDEDGKVREVKPISGDPVLVRAAIDAVSQWRYRPYLLDGRPIRRETQITLSFKLP